MPNNREIAEWLMEAAEANRQAQYSYERATWLNHAAKHKDISDKFEDRANLIESMRCETCRWWLGYGRDLSPIWECTRMAQRDEDDKGECEIGWCGPQFSCCHWEGKE
jgi:hypothetical protein